MMQYRDQTETVARERSTYQRERERDFCERDDDVVASRMRKDYYVTIDENLEQSPCSDTM